jgi:hypothetical protein
MGDQAGRSGPYTSLEQGLHDLNTVELVSDDSTANAESFRSRECGREGGRGWTFDMGPMDIHGGPIWRLTMARLAAGGLELDGVDDLFLLVCRCHESKDRARSDAVLGALVRLAAHDELATIGVLVALRPALLVLSRRLTGVGMDPAVAQDDVVATAYERVLAVAEQPTVHVARAVISSSWDRLRWSLRAEQRCALRHLPLSEIGDGVETGAERNVSELRSGSDLSSVLTEAVAAGVISATAAQIVVATRSHGKSFEALACELHKGEAALRKTRQRAEATLIAKGRGPGQRDVNENRQEAP